MIDSKSSHITNDGESITIVRTPTSYTGKAIIARSKGSYSDYAFEARRLINVLLASSLTTGEIVQTATESYLCVAAKNEVIQGTSAAILAHGLLCNTTVTITRTTITYDTTRDPSGETTTTIVSAAPCRADRVTYQMRLEDAGLLPGTSVKVYAKDSASVALLDKATIGSENYRVDDIDRLQIPGAMVLQLSAWTG